MVYFQIFLAILLIFILILSSIKIKKARQEIVRKPSPVLGNEALLSYAAALSNQDEAVPGKRGIAFLLNRMQENYRYIAMVYRKLNKNIRDKKRVPDNAEWLFDNFYIVEQQTRQISLSIKKRNYASLPVIRAGAYRGYPRIFALAHELVSHTDSVVNQDTLIDFVNAYQKNLRLRDEEIWSLETMLRIALIENIRVICDEIMETQNRYMLAEELSEELWKVRDRREKISALIGEHFRFFETEDSAYLEELVSRLRKHGPESRLILSVLKERLGKLGLNLDEITMLEHQKQAQRHVSLGNAITSLRTLLNMNFTYVFEQLSAVEHILLNDPAGVYPVMDKASKNYYRLRVNKLAKKWNISEIEAAKQTVQLASEYEGLDERKRHVGYYLKNQSLQYDRQPSLQSKKKLYLFSLILSALLLSTLFGFCAFLLTQHTILSILLGVLSLFPLSAVLQNILHYILAKSIKPALVPKLELADGVPENAKTLVVISTLLTGEDCANELTEKILMYSKANPEKNLYFGILSDFPDSHEENTEEDNRALVRLKENIKRLNTEYGNFYLFHRRRTFHRPDGKYMGRERKRGALCELNALISDGSSGSFSDIIGERRHLHEIKYVITLDSDTRLTLGSAKRLIGAMLHPLNRPIMNADGTKVEEGYGLLQPRISVDVKEASHSLFAGIFAGQGGIEPYSNTVSDIYQDLFEEGSYTGKGIYDVAVFKSILGNAIPDNVVLSHDLLEGSYIRCGLVSDIILIDGYPWRFQAYAKREHRWLRGDWQIFRWLLPKVRNKYGRRVKNPLDILEKWKIFDNLRRSLVKPALLICLFTAFHLPAELGVLLGGIVLATLLTNLLIATVEWFAGKGFQFTAQRFHATMVHGLEGAFYQTIIQFLVLPYEAYLTIDAILRVGWRTLISHRRLLEWTTAEQAQRNSKNTVIGYYREMVAELIAGLVLFVTVPSSSVIAGIIAVAWTLTPFIMFLISQPSQEKRYEPTREQRELLEDIAKRIWRYFSDFTNEKNHFLPPDNYQETPPNGVAPRTSPTNIGLYLVTALSAYDLQLIQQEELLDRLEKTMDTIQRLPKWKGQLYNWYNTRTMQPLRPTYVSAVDNGNYIAYLMTLEQGLRLLPDKGCKARVEHLAETVHMEIMQTDFSPLYDSERKLFYIGYHCEEGKVERSHYDLLASEARQLSYIAVANGSVPKEHWFELGRTLTESGAFRGLVSWTGTMFEYLMPLLIMKNIPNTLLDETYRFVLYCQKKYGVKRGVPWGTSESGFYAFDMELNYQYRAFGVPELGLKYGLSEDVVISPYSTIMALMVEPRAALENIERLAQCNLIGKYGFYEAIDFTPGRIPYREQFGVVRSYMAHHLGMSMLAIDNLLHHNIMQERFHHNIQIKAAEELLEERIPTRVIITRDNKTTLWPLEQIEPRDETAVRTIENISPHTPAVHMLTNGKMTCLLTDTGLGYSKLNDVCMNRFRFDLRQPGGKFIYLKNIKTKQVWSAAAAPVFSDSEEERVLFYPHKAEYYRLQDGIESNMQVAISAEHHVELQTLTLNNHNDEEIVLEITSYTEPLLCSQAADLAHRAFQNLFVQTAFEESSNALYAIRRTMDNGNPCIAFVSMRPHSNNISDISYETDRMRFLGRNRTVSAPKMVMEGINLSKTTGDILDPILAFRCRVVLPPEGSARLTMIYGMAYTKEEASQLLSLYREEDAVKRALDIAQMRSKNENEFLNFSAKQQLFYWELLSQTLFRPIHSLYPVGTKRESQKVLWKYGVSGDFPIVGITAEGNHYEPVQELLNAHEFWQAKGMRIDLIIVCKTNGSYRGNNQQELLKLTSPHTREYCRRTQGIYLLSVSTVEEADVEVMKTVSALWFHDHDFRLEKQMPQRQRKLQKHMTTPLSYAGGEVILSTPQLAFFNGYGGFTEDGKAYCIKLKPEVHTPLPWTNVIANEKVGRVITESGGGYAWSKNSHENRLTPWYNDYVTDATGEHLFVLDVDSGTVFSPFPQSVQDKNETLIRHGFGYTEFTRKAQEILQKATVFVPKEGTGVFCLLELTNEGEQTKKLRISHYIEPIAGTQQITSNQLEFSRSENSFFVHNSFRSEFPDSITVIAYSEAIMDFTCSREEFWPELTKVPAGVMAKQLSCANCAEQILCIATRAQLSLRPSEQRRIAILLAEGNNEEELRKLCRHYCTVNTTQSELSAVNQFWDALLGTVHVETPEQSLNFMLNGWLLYQTLSCRIWGRSGYYQSGGAYGFRDQLQDSMALLYAAPEITRKQIIKHAAHQFEEGDVQHWWHETSEEISSHKGVRTNMSDDLLWLPYVTAAYLTVTEDEEILSENIPFLKGVDLNGEDERYFPPQKSEITGDLYEHCLRSIRHSLKFGAHHLPLIGSGDWNDGMNRIGNQGNGESVWLGWFLIDVLKKFIPICKKRGDDAAAKEFENVLSDLTLHIDEAAWDGEWYRRAYFDDGTPVGSAMNTECKIDSLSQSWAVISGAGNPEHVTQALESLKAHLVDQEHGLIKLLSPPFEGKENNPGYIQNYLPGIRENGGQYTHAAVWAIKAFAFRGEGETATALYQMLNPIYHARTQIEAETYKTEPYVISADIYSNACCQGRGGWSWYTGAAAWYYRVGLEDILGFRKEGEKIIINPCVSPDWEKYTLHYKTPEKTLNITVQNPNRKVGLKKPCIIFPNQSEKVNYTITLDKS